MNGTTQDVWQMKLKKNQKPKKEKYGKFNSF